MKTNDAIKNFLLKRTRENNNPINSPLGTGKQT